MIEITRRTRHGTGPQQLTLRLCVTDSYSNIGEYESCNLSSTSPRQSGHVWSVSCSLSVPLGRPVLCKWMTGYRLGVHDSNVALPHLSSSDDVVQPHECYLSDPVVPPYRAVALQFCWFISLSARRIVLTCWSWHFINMQYTNPNENHIV